MLLIIGFLKMKRLVYTPLGRRRRSCKISMHPTLIWAVQRKILVSSQMSWISGSLPLSLCTSLNSLNSRALDVCHKKHSNTPFSIPATRWFLQQQKPWNPISILLLSLGSAGKALARSKKPKYNGSNELERSTEGGKHWKHTMTTKQLLAKTREGKLGVDRCHRKATANKRSLAPAEDQQQQLRRMKPWKMKP